MQDYKRQVTNYKRYSSFFFSLTCILKTHRPNFFTELYLTKLPCHRPVQARDSVFQAKLGQKEKAEPWVPVTLGYWLIRRVWDFHSRARCRVVKHPTGVPSAPGSRLLSRGRMFAIAKSTVATKIPIAVAVTFAHWARFQWPLVPIGLQHLFDWTQFLLASDTLYQVLRCSWLIPQRTCGFLECCCRVREKNPAWCSCPGRVSKKTGHRWQGQQRTKAASENLATRKLSTPLG